jgi:hypothetical protein
VSAITVDFSAIRAALSKLPSDHDASGEHRPTVDEIFTPSQHANALDPNTPVVVGARGTGKSFWAGVLGQDETRMATASAYPSLLLDRLVVKPGYSGLPGDGSVSAGTIQARIPRGKEPELAARLWQAVIIRAAHAALDPAPSPPHVREVMEKFADPEDAEQEFNSLEELFRKQDRTLLVTFDALDNLSREWVTSSLLVDALFEVVWGLRARRHIKAKVFIRPEQLNDESLRFVELPKLRSGRVELEWGQVDLYGLLFWRLGEATGDPLAQTSFLSLVSLAGISTPSDPVQRRRRWQLLTDRSAQKLVMERLAGLYMGKTNKKGATYDWPYNHLGDADGKVTPRSFIKLFVEAARFGQAPIQQAISAEGIRQGLREASKVRVDQLGIEYKWIKRALAPLAGLVVPCEPERLYLRWEESNTVPLILEAAADVEKGFLPPFPLPAKENQLELLATAMQQINVLSVREDGRLDIPDLFRVAAQMLKKGGIPPQQKS